jgi:RNA polymerase sigma-70 factor (ECF subfamily)
VEAPTDEHLVREFLDGDAASFELLVRRHSPELFQFALRLTGSSMAAEDVVQETFLKVYTSAESFDPARRFKPWLFTVAANKARDQLRRRGRRREVPFDAQINNDQNTKQRYLDLLLGESTAPDEDLLVDEKRRLVRDVVEEMPDKLAEVLVLAYYHRFPYKEIGEILDVPLGTVKSRLHAAVSWFADHYRRAVAEREKNTL